MLRIEHFTKRYGEKTAVEDLCLHIAPGEIYGFIGHNGAGKTTTLKACCGILNFTEGEIFVDGLSIREKPVDCKKRLAYIPDDPCLYDFMRGMEYLHFVADVYAVEQNLRRERIARYGEIFDLTKDLQKPIGSYSHGMKQKLALISAFIHEPKLLILDEPFVGLDPKAAHSLKGLMADLCQRGGAIFFSTHVLEVAEKLCHKIAILKDGRLVAAGETAAVKGESSLENLFLELVED